MYADLALADTGSSLAAAAVCTALACTYGFYTYGYIRGKTQGRTQGFDEGFANGKITGFDECFRRTEYFESALNPGEGRAARRARLAAAVGVVD